MALFSVNKSGFGNIRALITDIAFEMTDTSNKPHNQEYFLCVYPPAGAPGSGTLYSINPPNKLLFDPNGPYPFEKVVILESRLASDPLANANVSVTSTDSINAAWRLAFVSHNENTLTVHAGTRLTLPGIETRDATTEGRMLFMTNRATNPDNLEFRDPPGCINVGTWTNYTGINSIFGTLPATNITGRAPAAGDLIYPSPNYSNADEVFINRVNSQGATNSYPLNYQLTITNRGVALVIWEDNQEEVPRENVQSAGFNRVTDPVQVYGNSPVRWFVIQRAVDRNSGAVRGGYSLRAGKKWSLVDEMSRCPVFCVFGNSNPAYYQKFVVRENDQLTPSPKRPASVDTVDSAAILNPWPQQSVTEQGEFIVTFISNLSTSRFRYGDEMDMIGTVGSEVVGHGTKIRVKVYQDTQTREYTAMYGNLPFGQGMKIMILTDAEDVDEDANTGLPCSSISHTTAFGLTDRTYP